MIKYGKIDVKLTLVGKDDKEKVLSFKEEVDLKLEEKPLKVLGKKVRAWLTSIAKNGN